MVLMSLCKQARKSKQGIVVPDSMSLELHVHVHSLYEALQCEFLMNGFA